MLRVIVNDGDKIDRALKQFKRKCNNTKLIQELRSRKEFEKPSVTARKQTRIQHDEYEFLLVCWGSSGDAPRFF